MPVAAPSAANRLLAKIALRSGFAAMAAVVICAAIAGSFCEYSWPTETYLPPLAATAS